MDLGMRAVLRQGEPVELTSVEFGLLEVLLRNSGMLVSRKELAKTVLGRPKYGRKATQECPCYISGDDSQAGTCVEEMINNDNKRG